MNTTLTNHELASDQQHQNDMLVPLEMRVCLCVCVCVFSLFLREIFADKSFSSSSVCFSSENNDFNVGVLLVTEFFQSSAEVSSARCIKIAAWLKTDVSSHRKSLKISGSGSVEVCRAVIPHCGFF